MIGFRVSLNAEHLCTAAAGDRGVLTTAVTWVLRSAAGVKGPSDLRLEIGGLSDESHLRWSAPRKLRVGDEVLIKIVETAAADPPARVEREDQGLVEEQERRYYERLKAKFGD